MTVRWDLAQASDFLSSCGRKASRSRVFRAQVGLVRVSKVIPPVRLGRLCHGPCSAGWEHALG